MSVREVRGLGIGGFLVGITPTREPRNVGFYETGRLTHRDDGRASMVDFLPRGLLTNQVNNEEVLVMPTQPSTTYPGATLGSTKPKTENKNAKVMGYKPSPNPGNSLK